MPLQPSDLVTILALIRKEASKHVTAPLTLPEFSIREGELWAGDINLGVVVGPRGDDGDDGDDGQPGQDGKDGRDGSDGRDGIDGDDGRPGDDGRDGIDGSDGADGRDGDPGQRGVGIRDTWIDPEDGHLYIELTDGRLQDCGRVVGKDGKDGKPGRNGYGGGLVTTQGGGGGLSATFETVSKNLPATGGVLAYGPDGLASITYASGIVKTLAYSPDGLASVTLSGNTPSGIALVKTLTYTSGELTGFSYS